MTNDLMTVSPHPLRSKVYGLWSRAQGLPTAASPSPFRVQVSAFIPFHQVYGLLSLPFHIPLEVPLPRV